MTQTVQSIELWMLQKFQRLYSEHILIEMLLIVEFTIINVCYFKWNLSHDCKLDLNRCKVYVDNRKLNITHCCEFNVKNYKQDLHHRKLNTLHCK